MKKKKKKKPTRRIKKPNSKLLSLQNNANSSQGDEQNQNLSIREKEELEKKLKETAEQLDEESSKRIRLYIASAILLFFIVIFTAVGFVFYKKSKEKNGDEPQNTSSDKDGADGIELESEYQSLLTSTPTPTNLSNLSFQEEGKIKYGDLTEYIGMSAGEVIDLIGEPYDYQCIQDNETEATGGLWFDQDVMFTFCDSGSTLNMSCKVYMVWVQNQSGMGIAKNLGNGIDSTMNSDTLSLVLGSSLSNCYSDKLQGGITLGARCGEYLYDFRWGIGGTHYDLDFAPDRIIIYKCTTDETKGAGSADQLINRYFWAWQFADSEMMINLIWPQELYSIKVYLGEDRDDCINRLDYVLGGKRESNSSPMYWEAIYKYRLVNERPVTQEDYFKQYVLQAYSDARIKPEKITFFDEVYITTADGEKYTLLGEEVVGLCFDGRWYLPSYYTGFWGLTNDEFLSLDGTGLRQFHVR